MYKIQIGYEEGFYVLYLAKHYEGVTEETIEEEIIVYSSDEIRESIPEHWIEKLTSFLYN